TRATTRVTTMPAANRRRPGDWWRPAVHRVMAFTRFDPPAFIVRPTATNVAQARATTCLISRDLLFVHLIATDLAWILVVSRSREWAYAVRQAPSGGPCTEPSHVDED